MIGGVELLAGHRRQRRRAGRPRPGRSAPRSRRSRRPASACKLLSLAGIEPDAHGVLRAEQLVVADARRAAERILDGGRRR